MQLGLVEVIHLHIIYAVWDRGKKNYFMEIQVVKVR